MDRLAVLGLPVWRVVYAISTAPAEPPLADQPVDRSVDVVGTGTSRRELPSSYAIAGVNKDQPLTLAAAGRVMWLAG